MGGVCFLVHLHVHSCGHFLWQVRHHFRRDFKNRHFLWHSDLHRREALPLVRTPVCAARVAAVNAIATVSISCNSLSRERNRHKATLLNSQVQVNVCNQGLGERVSVR
jgi:hypothetical protein